MTNILISGGKLTFKGKEYRCAFGKNGFTDNKVEGDNKTPIGKFPLREVFYRHQQPETLLKTTKITEDMGWCDAPDDAHYNKLVTLPYSASHEKMLRDDALYDFVLVIGWNDNPPIAGKGSAIFMHVAKPEYAETEGCIALKHDDLLEVLAALEGNSEIEIFAG